jgi:ATP-dependent DNA ligase
VHELKHDGYWLQIHVRDGRVRLFTMNGHNGTDRYPRIVEEAGRIKGASILDAEVVCLDEKGMAEFKADTASANPLAHNSCFAKPLLIQINSLRSA